MHTLAFQQSAEPCFQRCWRIFHSFWHCLVSCYPWIYQCVQSRGDVRNDWENPDTTWDVYLAVLDIARNQRGDRSVSCWVVGVSFFVTMAAYSKITTLLAHGTLPSLQLYISLVILFWIWIYSQRMDAKQIYALDTAYKSRKYDVHTVVGIIQLIKLSLSFCIYTKVFVCTVEGTI
jgi:hypothetical protein